MIGTTQVQSLELVGRLVVRLAQRVAVPDRGTRMSICFNAAVPGSDVEYYVAGIDF